MQFHTHTPKEVMVGTTRRVVRERCLPPAHIQPDGPAVRPSHPNVGVYDAFKREMVSVVPPGRGFTNQVIHPTLQNHPLGFFVSS